jgi:hypothetical protein
MQLLLKKVDQPSSVIGEIHEIDTGNLYASVVDCAVGSDTASWYNACKGSPRVVLRCADPVRADAAVSAADRLLSSWSQSGWARFDEELADLDKLVSDQNMELMIRPNAKGMLSDAICTSSWARRSEGLDCSLMLDPLGWLVPSMMRDVDDHLTRIAELCQSCPKIGAVLIRSVRADGSDGLEETSLGGGDIDPELIVNRLGGLVKSARAVIVQDRADMAMLGL